MPFHVTFSVVVGDGVTCFRKLGVANMLKLFCSFFVCNHVIEAVM